MSRWILDDGPLEWLATHVPLETIAGWPTETFFVAQAVKQAAVEGAIKNPSAKRRLDVLEIQPAVFQTFEITLGSSGFDVLYRHLRQPSGSSKNLAENQAIAWVMTESPQAILVVVDKRASVDALAELGLGRVAHAFDLWLHLLHQNFIGRDHFTALCASTAKKDPGLPGVPLRCR